VVLCCRSCCCGVMLPQLLLRCYVYAVVVFSVVAAAVIAS
jgi:hypothetical protein